MNNNKVNAARTRIASLLDHRSFVEIGGSITARNTDFNLAELKAPGDGVITGYGTIDGRLVYVYSQDPTVLSGTIGEMHSRKISNIYDMALRMGSPVIGLIDCAGLRLQEATDALHSFGEIYSKQVKASGVVPQITGIFGSCGGGLALLSALSDFTFMEETQGKLFINSPNALVDEESSSSNTASANFQGQEAGNIDVSGTEDYIISEMRRLIELLPSNNQGYFISENNTDDLNRLCHDIKSYTADTARALAEISDNHLFYEIKRSYAKDMVAGFIKINGMTVGAIANRTEAYNAESEETVTYDNVLSAGGCSKAAKLVAFCDAFNIPVLTLTNVKGYESSVESEKEMAQNAGRLIYAFASATVPKVNLIIGDAIGNGYNVMNSKALGADLTFTWPKARIGMIDSLAAAKIMYPDASLDTIKEKAAEYERLQASVESAAERGYVDNVIEPQDTRKYIIAAFEMLYGKRVNYPEKKHGTL